MAGDDAEPGNHGQDHAERKADGEGDGDGNHERPRAARRAP
jgi:hypothetical protein